LIEATDNLTSLHEHEEKLRAGSLEPSFSFSEAGAGDLI
jgi:hypothetical protein